jgi:hypothetical protein
MLNVLFQSSDVVATSFGAAIIGTLGCGLLELLGLTWVGERWRLPLALSGVAVLVSCVSYVQSGDVWLATHGASSAYRYVAWFTVQPLQVASIYFLARIAGPVPIGVFWRTVVAAVLMVLSRYLADARIFDPTLGTLLSIAFWLYILGELYFGAMAQAVARASRPIRTGYFWIRLIFTVGWALYPILAFTDLVIGAGYVSGVVVLYTIADLVNLVVVSLIVLAVAGLERH